jgi:hypothetical protein
MQPTWAQRVPGRSGQGADGRTYLHSAPALLLSSTACVIAPNLNLNAAGVSTVPRTATSSAGPPPGRQARCEAVAGFDWQAAGNGGSDSSQRDRVAAGRCRPPGDPTRRGPGRARAPSPSSESRHCASSRSLLGRNSGAAVVVTSKLSLAWTPAKPGSPCWQPGMQVQVPASGIRTPWMRMARGIPVYTGKYR